MFPSWPIEQLQRAGAFFSYQRRLRAISLQSLAVSIFFCFLGVISLNYPFAAFPSIVAGVWLLIYAAAMWFLAPPQAFRVGDISGVVALLINISLLVYESFMYTRPAGQYPRGFMGIAFLIIVFGFIHFSYKRTVQSAPPSLSLSEVYQFKSSMQVLITADARLDNRIIQIRINNTSIKAILEHEYIVFIAGKGQAISILRPEDFEIVVEPSQANRQNMLVKMRMAEQWAAARMGATSYERYQQWSLHRT
jgi:hypothetical protein